MTVDNFPSFHADPLLAGRENPGADFGSAGNIQEDESNMEKNVTYDIQDTKPKSMGFWKAVLLPGVIPVCKQKIINKCNIELQWKPLHAYIFPFIQD